MLQNKMHNIKNTLKTPFLVVEPRHPQTSKQHQIVLLYMCTHCMLIFFLIINICVYCIHLCNKSFASSRATGYLPPLPVASHIYFHCRILFTHHHYHSSCTPFLLIPSIAHKISNVAKQETNLCRTMQGFTMRFAYVSYVAYIAYAAVVALVIYPPDHPLCHPTIYN